jgi:hypothetical protein
MESFNYCIGCGTLTNVRQLEGEILYPGDYPQGVPHWVKLCPTCHSALVKRGSMAVNGVRLQREKPAWWI